MKHAAPPSIENPTSCEPATANTLCESHRTPSLPGHRWLFPAVTASNHLQQKAPRPGRFPFDSPNPRQSFHPANTLAGTIHACGILDRIEHRTSSSLCDDAASVSEESADGDLPGLERQLDKIALLLTQRADDIADLVSAQTNPQRGGFPILVIDRGSGMTAIIDPAHHSDPDRLLHAMAQPLPHREERQLPGCDRPLPQASLEPEPLHHHAAFHG